VDVYALVFLILDRYGGGGGGGSGGGGGVRESHFGFSRSGGGGVEKRERESCD